MVIILCINIIVGFDVRSIEAKDKNIEACFSYRDSQDYKKAIESGKRAIKNSPNDFDSHFCLGSTFARVGEYKLALSELKKAGFLSTNKEDLAANASYLGNVYQILSNNDEALKHFNRALKLRRETANFHGIAQEMNNIAGIYFDWGLNDKAFEYYQEALKAEPDELEKAPYYSNIATLLNNQGKYAEAESNILSAIKLSERKGDYHAQSIYMIKLGDYQYRKGDYKAAEISLLEGLRKTSSIGDVYWEGSALQILGWVSDELGNKKQAIDYLKKALEIFTRIGAAKQIKDAQEQLNDINKSLQ